MIDIDHIIHALGLILEPGQATELRVLDVSHPSYRQPHIVSGYFDDVQKLAEEAAGLAARASYRGMYFLPNAIDSALLSRAANRIRPARRDPLTGDPDVRRRRFLLIDVDPNRASGISSTDAEHEAALATARQITRALAAEGWPAPLLADSGNGAHLLYRIDLPPNDGGLVVRCLSALAFRFNDGVVAIDETVHNPARLCRLYGSMSCKGDNTADRPHRMARLMQVPEKLVVVTPELLQNVVAGFPTPTPHPHAHKRVKPHSDTGSLDVDVWLKSSGLTVTGPTPRRDGQKWLFDVCPWNAAHRNRSAYVVQHPGGAIAAGCHHTSCRHNDWHGLRALIEGQQGTGSGGGRRRNSGSTPPSSHASSKDALLPHVPFPTNLLPDPVRRYVETGAKSIGCPADYIALPLLASFASAIGNSRRILLKPGYTLPPVVWSMIIGGSGARKSPALRHALRPAWKKQGEAVQQHEREITAYKSTMLQFDKQLMAWNKSGGSGGPPPTEPDKPSQRRYICSDVTIEALAPLLNKNRRGLLLTQDELVGWLESFDAYRQGRGGDASKWLSMHDAGPLLVDRKTGDDRQIFIPQAAVCVTGGIQPHALRRALGEKHLDNGLAARFLLCYPPERPGRWTDSAPDPRAEAEVESILDRLLNLQMDTSRPGEPTPVFVPLTDDARKCFATFVNENAEELASFADPHLAAVWSKLEGYAARLALVLHQIKTALPSRFNPPRAVAHDTMEEGIKLARWFGFEARRVYAMLRESAQDRETRELVEFIRRRDGQVSCRDVMRGGPCFKTADEAEAALNGLADAGLGEWTWPPSEGPGRPVRIFRLAQAADADTTTNPVEPAAVSSVSVGEGCPN